MRDLGRRRYADALALQREAVERVLSWRADVDRPAGELLLVEHDPPVITIGRRREASAHVVAPAEKLAALGVELVETDRGGDVTWHGPGQIVAYPILDLDRLGLRIHPYMRMLEECVLSTIAAFGVNGHRDESATGVWVGGDGAVDAAGSNGARADTAAEARPARKIAAMGVRVSRWVSMHGLALNVENDLSHFGLIVPCGLHGRPVTSLRAELGDAAPSIERVRSELVASIERAVDDAINLRRG